MKLIDIIKDVSRSGRPLTCACGACRICHHRTHVRAARARGLARRRQRVQRRQNEPAEIREVYRLSTDEDYTGPVASAQSSLSEAAYFEVDVPRRPKAPKGWY